MRSMKQRILFFLQKQNPDTLPTNTNLENLKGTTHLERIIQQPTILLYITYPTQPLEFYLFPFFILFLILSTFSHLPTSKIESFGDG